MTRLILTADASSAGALEHAGCADLVIPIERRFVWGRPPSGAELAAFLAPRAMQGPGAHWLDHAAERTIKRIGATDVGLLDLFQRYVTVELWMGTEPNAQLVLTWLLDYLRVQAQRPKNVILRHVDSTLGDASPDHRANILGASYTDFGAGRAQGATAIFWTQNFGAGGIC